MLVTSYTSAMCGRSATASASAAFASGGPPPACGHGAAAPRKARQDKSPERSGGAEGEGAACGGWQASRKQQL